jgi:hypothetical protein
MFAREYHIRANRQGRRRLQGEQLDITFPRRGRPSKFRRLERAGQMRLQLHGKVQQTAATSAPAIERKRTGNECDSECELKVTPETFDAALQMTFPVRPLTQDELAAEFERLFPLN